MLIIQVIGGFTQDEGSWNGCLELREKLLSELDEYSGLSVRVRFDQHNANWRHIARQIYLLRLRYHKAPFHVVVFAYSWGVGQGLVRLARRLMRYGIKIEVAVISDGIYRHWFSFGNWRAMVGGYRITLPDSIRLVHAYYQRQERPHGAQPIHPNVQTWEELELPHIEMDDAIVWHERCIAVAKRWAAFGVGGTESVPAGAPPSAALDSRLAPEKQENRQ